MEVFSRNRVWEHKYSGSMLSRDPFELTGSLDDKGKKMLLLHLMHNAIYDDSRRYLLNQVSALEEQRRQNLLESQGKELQEMSIMAATVEEEMNQLMSTRNNRTTAVVTVEEEKQQLSNRPTAVPVVEKQNNLTAII